MHACNQVLHALLIFMHPFWATFLVLHLGFFSVGQGIVSCPNQCHTVHFSRVHKQLFLILKDGEPARLQFAPLLIVHLINISQGEVTCYGLSEVRTKEGNLISRESSQHYPEIRQPLPIPIIVICYLPSMAPWHVKN